MADLHTTVIVVERVGNGTVSQSSVCHRNFETGAEYRCLRRPAELRYVSCDGPADRLGDAGQGSTDTVQGGALRFLHDIAGYVLVAGVDDELSNFFSGAHASPNRGHREKVGNSPRRRRTRRSDLEIFFVNNFFFRTLCSLRSL